MRPKTDTKEHKYSTPKFGYCIGNRLNIGVSVFVSEHACSKNIKRVLTDDSYILMRFSQIPSINIVKLFSSCCKAKGITIKKGLTKVIKKEIETACIRPDNKRRNTNEFSKIGRLCMVRCLQIAVPTAHLNIFLEVTALN